jgi:flavin reductase (DIM6/NTAB) family NADH-FMN oxidoreductase RutF/rubredoxin
MRMNFDAFYKLECGMYIISTAHDGKLNGQLMNAMVQVAAVPPKIAVSLNKQNLTCQMCAKSGVFSVSVLDREPPMTFIGRWGFKSGRDTDKFEGINYRMGKNGAPIVLDHAVAFFEAKVTASLDIGTHMVLIGEVTEAEIISDVEPMDYNYYRQVKKGMTSKFAATYQAKPENAGAGSGGPGTGKSVGMTVPPLVAPQRYRCAVCGYIYDPGQGVPESGIKPGTPFEALPADWKCPVCGAGKHRFVALPP